MAAALAEPPVANLRSRPADAIRLVEELDGLQVLADLRADARTFSAPVAILSNYDEPELIETGLQLGAIDHQVESRTAPGQVSSSVARWMVAHAA